VYSNPMSVPLTLLGLLERETQPRLRPEARLRHLFRARQTVGFRPGLRPRFARLSRDGKVVPGEAEPGDGPDRKRYAITPEGKEEFEAWLAEPVTPEPHLQTVLFSKVVLALMLGRSAEQYLRYATRGAFATDA